MNKCSECNRPLKKGENDLCPSCDSTKSHKKKKWVEIVGTISLFVIGIPLYLLSKSNNKGQEKT